MIDQRQINYNRRPNGFKMIFLIFLVVLIAGFVYLITRPSKSSKQATVNNNANLNLNQSQTNVNSETANLNGNVNSLVSLKKDYQNKTYHFTVQYPQNYQLAEKETGESFNLTFTSGNDRISLSILPTALEGVIGEDSLSLQKREEIKVAGFTAVKLVGGNLKDGSPLNVIYFTKDNKLYSFSGYGEAYEAIVASFKSQ